MDLISEKTFRLIIFESFLILDFQLRGPVTGALRRRSDDIPLESRTIELFLKSISNPKDGIFLKPEIVDLVPEGRKQ